MKLTLDLGKKSYDIIVFRGALDEIGTLLPLHRRVLVVTDDGVPEKYAKTVADACDKPTLITVPMGEGSKSIGTLERLCSAMLEEGFTRTDAVVAVGGGVVGDLSGFAAACYMRGIDFYNIPTTLLSQVDSSIGGKTAVNLNGVKNCIGAFYQPKRVVIDPDVLVTLPPRQISNGLAEAIKMAATCDEELFSLMENEPLDKIIDKVIEGSLKIKKYVVEQDETEKGLRRVLNFGHTLGHGIESSFDLDKMYHGECVALGMLPMCSDEARPRIKALLEKANLPTEASIDMKTALKAVSHDKKLDGSTVNYVFVPKIGSFELKSASLDEFERNVLARNNISKEM